MPYIHFPFPNQNNEISKQSLNKATTNCFLHVTVPNRLFQFECITVAARMRLILNVLLLLLMYQLCYLGFSLLPVHGIQNHANNCYASSVLQLLGHNTRFVKKCLEKRTQKTTTASYHLQNFFRYDCTF